MNGSLPPQDAGLEELLRFLPRLAIDAVMSCIHTSGDSRRVRRVAGRLIKTGSTEVDNLNGSVSHTAERQAVVRPALFPVLLRNPAGSLRAQTGVEVPSGAIPEDDPSCSVWQIIAKAKTPEPAHLQRTDLLRGSPWITVATSFRRQRPLRCDLPASRLPDPRRLPGLFIDLRFEFMMGSRGPTTLPEAKISAPW